MEDLRGKKIAIDGTMLMCREYASPWLPVEQPKKNILWAIRLMRLCRRYEIFPIVIFDSPKSTAAKAKERAKRTVRKEKYRAELENVKSKVARLGQLASTMGAIDGLGQQQQAEVLKQFQKSRQEAEQQVEVLKQLQESSEVAEQQEESAIEEESLANQEQALVGMHDLALEDTEQQQVATSEESFPDTDQNGASNYVQEGRTEIVGESIPLTDQAKTLIARDLIPPAGRNESARPPSDNHDVAAEDDSTIASSANDLQNSAIESETLHLPETPETQLLQPAEEAESLAELTETDDLQSSEEADSFVEMSDHDQLQPAEESAQLAQRLVEHLKLVMATGTQDSASELSLLLKLLQPGSGIPLAELGNLQAQTAEIMEKLSRRVTFPTFKDISDTIATLKQYAIPTQFSPDFFEGECTASYYARQGHVDYVATDDSDVLVYGVPQIRAFLSLKHTNRFNDPYAPSDLTLVDPVVMRAGLNQVNTSPWSEANFVDFAILCGTDFTVPIPQVGTKRAHHVIDKQRNFEAGVQQIEDIRYKTGDRKGEPRYKTHEGFYNDAEIARMVFNTFPDTQSLLARVLDSHDSQKTLRAFQDLCRSEYRWSAIEKSVLEENGMTREDIEVLDGPSLYNHSKQSGSSVEQLIGGVQFNDHPDRAAANDSGFSGRILQ